MFPDKILHFSFLIMGRCHSDARSSCKGRAFSCPEFHGRRLPVAVETEPLSTSAQDASLLLLPPRMVNRPGIGLLYAWVDA